MNYIDNHLQQPVFDLTQLAQRIDYLQHHPECHLGLRCEILTTDHPADLSNSVQNMQTAFDQLVKTTDGYEYGPWRCKRALENLVGRTPGHVALPQVLELLQKVHVYYHNLQHPDASFTDALWEDAKHHAPHQSLIGFTAWQQANNQKYTLSKELKLALIRAAYCKTDHFNNPVVRKLSQEQWMELYTIVEDYNTISHSVSEFSHALFQSLHKSTVKKFTSHSDDCNGPEIDQAAQDLFIQKLFNNSSHCAPNGDLFARAMHGHSHGKYVLSPSVQRTMIQAAYSEVTGSIDNNIRQMEEHISFMSLSIGQLVNFCQIIDDNNCHFPQTEFSQNLYQTICNYMLKRISRDAAETTQLITLLQETRLANLVHLAGSLEEKLTEQLHAGQGVFLTRLTQNIDAIMQRAEGANMDSLTQALDEMGNPGKCIDHFLSTSSGRNHGYVRQLQCIETTAQVFLQTLQQQYAEAIRDLWKIAEQEATNRGLPGFTMYWHNDGDGKCTLSAEVQRLLVYAAYSGTESLHENFDRQYAKLSPVQLLEFYEIIHDYNTISHSKGIFSETFHQLVRNKIIHSPPLVARETLKALKTSTAESLQLLMQTLEARLNEQLQSEFDETLQNAPNRDFPGFAMYWHKDAAGKCTLAPEVQQQLLFAARSELRTSHPTGDGRNIPPYLTLDHGLTQLLSPEHLVDFCRIAYDYHTFSTNAGSDFSTALCAFLRTNVVRLVEQDYKKAEEMLHLLKTTAWENLDPVTQALERTIDGIRIEHDNLFLQLGHQGSDM